MDDKKKLGADVKRDLTKEELEQVTGGAVDDTAPAEITEEHELPRWLS